MLSSVFTFDLNQTIHHSLATIAYFDGRTPSLVCGTTGGKIFVHSPQTTKNDLNFLNINKTITCISSGRLNSDLDRDVLLVGSPTNLLAYDVEMNSDLFHKEVRDGVLSMAVGPVDVAGTLNTVALVGGNCSILGFDKTGEDIFWTVSGDNVSALAFGYVESKEKYDILVGSEDYAIRLFRNEEMLYEINESSTVRGFAPTHLRRYAYWLDNGTLGLYQQTARIWRVKTRHKVISAISSDIMGNGKQDLIVGWSNGRIEVRNEIKGDCVFKKMLKDPISKILQADYRLDGTQQLIACTETGKVVGFVAQENVEPTPEMKQDIIEDFTKQKQSILNEIKHYQGQKQESLHTNIDIQLSINNESKVPELRILTSSSLSIKGAVLFAEGILPGDSFFYLNPKPGPELFIPIENKNHLENDIEIKVLIGQSAASSQYIVKEHVLRLPKFSDYYLVNSGNIPTSYLSFDLGHYGPKLAPWIESRFLITQSRLALSGDFRICLQSKESTLGISVASNKLVFYLDNFEFAGDLMQDLASYLGVKDLESRTEFPNELAKLKQLMEKVEEFNSTRMQLMLNMAESSQAIKVLIVKSEDARLQHNMMFFKRSLGRLHQFNGELFGEFEKRKVNHTELINCMKQVNQIIQRAGNLRCGSAKTRVLTGLREAFKERNVNSMMSIVTNGYDA